FDRGQTRLARGNRRSVIAPAVRCDHRGKTRNSRFVFWSLRAFSHLRSTDWSRAERTAERGRRHKVAACRRGGFEAIVIAERISRRVTRISSAVRFGLKTNSNRIESQ